MMHRELTREPKELLPELKLVSSRIRPRNDLSPRTVLKELFVLLEDYAPTWYTKEHHDRAVAALLDREL
jgi:hypothetical protein